MRNDDIDDVLSTDETIVPSPGFTASVMQAVRREALSPPPIPFPWKRALPGLVSMGPAIVLGVARLAGGFGAQASTGSSLAELMAPAIHAAERAEAQLIVLALLLSLASVMLSMRLAARRT